LFPFGIIYFSGSRILNNKASTFTYSNFLTEILIQIFCKIQLALTLGFLYIWVRLRKPLALKKYEAEGAGEPNDPNPTTLI
jgi:hypothetical protein